MHHLAKRFAEFARRVELGDLAALRLELAKKRRSRWLAEHAAELAVDKHRGAARDVDVFADQVAVHPCDEVFRIEIEILDVGVELGGDVVAQPLRVHAELEVAQRADAGAARLRHFVARDGDEAVYVDVVGRLVARKFQHRRPEERVEVDDVLADEVDHLGAAARLHESLEIEPLALAVILQAGEIADRCVEPHVQVLLVRDIGHADAEVRRVARDVPVGERALTFSLEPLLRFVDHLRLQAPGRIDPAPQERLAFGV